MGITYGMSSVKPWERQLLDSMEDFHAQQVEVGTAKHLPLEKLEAIDMPLDEPIAPRKRAGGSNRGRIAADAIGKASQFGHPALFCLLEPSI